MRDSQLLGGENEGMIAPVCCPIQSEGTSCCSFKPEQGEPVTSVQHFNFYLLEAIEAALGASMQIYLYLFLLGMTSLRCA